MEQDIIKNTEIVEDMPDFEEITAEMPCEGEESVTENTADAENTIVSEENTEESADTEETPQDDTKEKKPKELNPYEKVILAEMERRAQNGDELLATAMQSKDKNIQSCYEYVKAQAKKQAVAGCAMIEDAVVYGWAHHYYIESKETIDKEMKKSAPKTEKKTAEKPKPVKNVLDITKAIVSATKGDTGKKREKKKDSLKAGFVPMERPDTLKDAKKGSREQAKSVEQLDMFADFFAE